MGTMQDLYKNWTLIIFQTRVSLDGSAKLHGTRSRFLFELGRIFRVEQMSAAPTRTQGEQDS
jgi:hypothetical protein